MGEDVEYVVLPMSVPYEFNWNQTGDFDLTIKKQHVQNRLWITIAIRSQRKFHAKGAVGLGKVDDVVKFGYEVLPPNNP